MSDIICKYCQSEHVVKYGKYKDVQRYFCKECKRKFASTETIPKMQTSTRTVADVLNMYYEGLSEAEIRRNLIQQDNSYISTGSVYNWVNRFSKMVILEANKYKPDVGLVWVADETVIDIDGKNIWFWDILDTRTRFLIASHMSFTRTAKDAQALMKQAYDRTGKIPRVIYTDKLRAYLDGIELTFGGDTTHKQGSPFDIENNTNLIERFHGTIKSRTKVMRGLRTVDSARLFMDGWLVHYNFFRPHMSLKDRTPASVAGICFPFRNWKDVVEQPYEVTARIPIKQEIPEVEVLEPDHTPTKKYSRVLRRKRRSIPKRRVHRTPTMTTLSRIRL
jgi:transposase-like protein